MIKRIVATVLSLGGYGLFNLFYSAPATLMSGEIAGSQFDDSAASYLSFSYLNIFLTHLPVLVGFSTLLTLLLIWWKPAKELWKEVIVTMGMLLIMLLFLHPHPAWAFADTVDKTEAYTILPNESAFWIPDVGANKETQTQLDSEAYLTEKKLATKRFVIPHAKLTGSGGTSWLSGWDFYVPTGRLIIVDRTPYSREWVDATDRGTSTRKEGFPCQSKEGLNIAAGVSIGASVSEGNAAKFLYRFGVLTPKGVRTDPQVIFASVYYGRSLTEVMDDVGRKKVQTLVCAEIGSRTFDQANSDMMMIMANVTKAATDYFAAVGITLDFIGWADTLTFDHEVQEAVNRRYIASQDKVAAETLQPYADTIRLLSQAQAIRSFGEKTNGVLPSTFVGLPPDIMGSLIGTGLVKSVAPAVTLSK